MECDKGFIHSASPESNSCGCTKEYGQNVSRQDVRLCESQAPGGGKKNGVLAHKAHRTSATILMSQV